MLQRLGKKRCMMISNVPSLAGWILLYQSYSSIFLCASTSMVGFSIGFSSNAILAYVAEISEPRLRGKLTSSSSIAVVIGTSLVFGLNTILHWRTIALVNASCPIICTCLIFFVRTILSYSNLLNFTERRVFVSHYCFLLLDPGVADLVDSERKTR